MGVVAVSVCLHRLHCSCIVVAVVGVVALFSRRGSCRSTHLCTLSFAETVKISCFVVAVVGVVALSLFVAVAVAVSLLDPVLLLRVQNCAELLHMRYTAACTCMAALLVSFISCVVTGLQTLPCMDEVYCCA